MLAIFLLMVLLPPHWETGSFILGVGAQCFNIEYCRVRNMYSMWIFGKPRIFCLNKKEHKRYTFAYYKGISRASERSITASTMI